MFEPIMEAHAIQARLFYGPDNKFLFLPCDADSLITRR